MRKYYIDNLKWVIVVSVVFYHVICVFNSAGVIMNYNAPGIGALDSIAYFFYPWFMPCMFLASGVCTRYSLKSRGGKAFVKDRTQRLLIPFVFGMLVIAPFVSWVTFTAGDLWNQFAALPNYIVYAIMLISGMGPLWFLLELYAVSMVFLLILRLDKNDTFYNKCSKANIWVILLLVVPAWGCAQVLNLLYTFRNGLYLFLFLLGYFVLSHDEVQEKLKKCCTPLLIGAVILFFVQYYMFKGQNFSLIATHPIVFLYGYVAMLAVFGCFARWGNVSNRFTQYMTSRSYSIYIFHYLPVIAIAYYTVSKFNFPTPVNYAVVAAAASAATVAACEIIRRIPIVNSLFGITKWHK